jgi:hypothetical protein
MGPFQIYYWWSDSLRILLFLDLFHSNMLMDDSRREFLTVRGGIRTCDAYFTHASLHFFPEELLTRSVLQIISPGHRSAQVILCR